MKSKMKKMAIGILVSLMVMSLYACGQSKEAKKADELINSIGAVTLESEDTIIAAEKAVENLSDEDKLSLKNLETLNNARETYDNLVIEEKKKQITSESWFGIYDADEYIFNEDGTGTHDGRNINYEFGDGKINITEGAAGTSIIVLNIDQSGDNVRLVPEGESIYYLNKTAFEEVSKEIQQEYIAELTNHEAWAIMKNGSFQAYFMFNESGDGFALTYAGTVGMSWKFTDNNTLELTVNNSKALYDIVEEDGGIVLYLAEDTSIKGTPHN